MDAREELGTDATSDVQNEAQQVRGLVSDSFEEVRASMCQNHNAEARPSNASTRSSYPIATFPMSINRFRRISRKSNWVHSAMTIDESTMDTRYIESIHC
jgi:hypothetical protein